MKLDYPRTGIATLCRLFGKTRHAWYDHQWRSNQATIKEEIIVQEVLKIRTDLPRVGTRKLHHLLPSRLAEHQLYVGRDQLFDILKAHGLLVKNRRRTITTTNSRHWMFKYKNLIKDITLHRPDQLWVSDITYIRMPAHFGYLSLITDAYSHRIMGYSFREDLSTAGCVDALRMALSARGDHAAALIHHSDRGSQYCSAEYVTMLTSANIDISMTENSDPYENAVAERVNGILKNEFGLHSSPTGFEQTRARIQQSIQAYNNLRPHSSCDFLTPQQAHLQSGMLKKRWKSYYKSKQPKKIDTFETTTPV